VRRQKCIDEDPPGQLMDDVDHVAACHYAEAARVL
jgi:hypothetical protein